MDELFIKIKKLETLIEIKKIKKNISDKKHAIHAINDVNLIDTFFLSFIYNFFSNFSFITSKVKNIDNLSALELISFYYNIIINNLKESKSLIKNKKKVKNNKEKQNKYNPLKLINNENYIENNPFNKLIVELEKGEKYIQQFQWNRNSTDKVKRECLTNLYSNIYFFIKSIIELVSLQDNVSPDDLEKLKAYLMDLDTIYSSIDDLFFDISEYRHNQSLLNDYANLLKLVDPEYKKERML